VELAKERERPASASGVTSTNGVVSHRAALVFRATVWFTEGRNLGAGLFGWAWPRSAGGGRLGDGVVQQHELILVKVP
jgi:hypothetical protein